MKVLEGAIQSPRPVPQSVRLDRCRGLTSVRAGLVNPVCFFPLLRGDAISGRVNVQVKMSETVKPLLNGVRCKVMAHLVPFTLAGNFFSLEQLNSAYEKQPTYAGSPTPPFIPVASVPASSEIYDKLGIHLKSGVDHNAYLVRAYNTLINQRRMTRSENLPERAFNDHSLARGFWADPNRWEIVPDFDAKLIDGMVPLSGSAPIKGLGLDNRFTGAFGQNMSIRETGKDTPTQYPFELNSNTAQTIQMATSSGDPATAWPLIFAELEAAGVGVNLASMAMVQKTVAFAKVREQYAGGNWDFVIDLLMDGLSVPDAALFEPMLLGSASGVFGMMERHATDFENLDKSVTTGMLSLNINVRTPAINPGGVVLVTLEIVPESLPELGADPFLTITDQEEWPHSVRDELDPEKVEIVDNKEIDAYHSQPDGVFGYSFLNYRWQRDFARVGGKFKDGATPSNSEERYRIWQVRPTNPDLTEDFYLCPKPFPHDVFADTAADPFEVVTLATMQIRGRTVFGERLRENTGSYEDIVAEWDTAKIGAVQPAAVEQHPAQPEESSGGAAGAADADGTSSPKSE